MNHLHWLRVQQWAMYKIAVLTYKISVHLSARPPISSTKWLHTTCQLRSSDHYLLSQPTDNTSCAFSSTTPRIRNSLPLLARPNSTICRHLQTTPEDLPVLLHHGHWLTNHSIHAYELTPVFDIWHTTNTVYLLTYLNMWNDLRGHWKQPASNRTFPTNVQ